MKVKYISSPIMVNAKNADEFRSIVQELTGKSPERGGDGGSSGGGGGGGVGGGGWINYHDGVEYKCSRGHESLPFDQEVTGRCYVIRRSRVIVMHVTRRSQVTAMSPEGHGSLPHHQEVSGSSYRNVE
ncbi:hypothetical protein CQW23_13052 [Capsicum baccatum]|uniref:VQ domain-containing protein n=1 Tax=Capsicum baccatum TaxID=33114 RepID=A0A2G2WUC1_CAPBA|nr:hypothetical protein CQW23_13052 [Capsicum baccatum]